MSSDSELEPTPPKLRRLPAGSMACGIGNILARDNGDTHMSNDCEPGREYLERQSSSGSLSAFEEHTSFSDNGQIATTSKDSTDPNKNVKEEDGACSRTSVESDTKDVDKCPICWAPFTDQEIATPLICDHRFCLHCLIEWTKTTNTCPVDRIIFDEVIVKPKLGSSERRVKVTRLDHDRAEEEDRDRFVEAVFEVAFPAFIFQEYENSDDSDVLEGENFETVSPNEYDEADFSNSSPANSSSFSDVIPILSVPSDFSTSPSGSREISSASSDCIELSSSPLDCNELSSSPSECNELPLSPTESNELSSPSSECNELFSSPVESNELSSPSECDEFSLSCSEPFSPSVASDSPPSSSFSSVSSFSSRPSSSTSFSLD